MVSSKKADDDSSGQAMTEERQTTPSSTTTRSSSMLRYFQTLDRIDVFGFSLTWKQLLIVLIAAGMMLGENGRKFPPIIHIDSQKSLSYRSKVYESSSFCLGFPIIPS